MTISRIKFRIHKECYSTLIIDVTFPISSIKIRPIYRKKSVDELYSVTQKLKQHKIFSNRK